MNDSNQNLKDGQHTRQVNSGDTTNFSTKPINSAPSGTVNKNFQTQQINRNTKNIPTQSINKTQPINSKVVTGKNRIKELKDFISANGNLTVKNVEKKINEIVDIINADVINLQKKIDFLTVKFNESEKNIATTQIQFKNKIEKLQDEAQKKIEIKIKEINDSQKKELDEFKKKALEKEMVELLNINDQFEFALNAEIKNEIVSNYVSGFKMINNMLTGWMESVGVKNISINPGDNFDETKMTSIDSVNSNFPANCVVSVLKKGYMMNGKVIRYASVVISTGNKK